MAYTITQVDKLNRKSKTHEVSRICRHTYRVISGASGNQYEVNVRSGRCSCKRQQYIGWRLNDGVNACSHYLAAYRAHERENGRQAVPRPADMDVRHLHRMSSAYGDGVSFTLRRASVVTVPQAEPDPTSDLAHLSLDELNEALFG
jgi:hypothetical protein